MKARSSRRGSDDEIAEMLDLIDIDRLGGIDGAWVEQGKPVKKKYKILRSDAEVILESMRSRARL